MDGRLDRCRRLEGAVRDQEKIITLLENELQRRRLCESEYSVSPLFRPYQTVFYSNAFHAFSLTIVAEWQPLGSVAKFTLYFPNLNFKVETKHRREAEREFRH